MAQSPAGGQRRPRRRLWIIVLVIILLLILLILLFFFPRPTATVTLTATSKTVTTTIKSDNLYSSPSDLAPGVPTGSKLIPGIQAIGSLTFQNYTPSEVTIPKGTRVKNNAGQEVETIEDITIPPDPPVIPGVMSAQARAVNAGKNGNIEAMSVNTIYNNIPEIKVFNQSAFSGGSDEHTASIVLQGDVDKVANPLKTQLMQKALSDIQSQLPSGEKLVNPTPQCSTDVTPSPGVGEIATTFNVTVSLKCFDPAYNPQDAMDKLNQKAAQEFPGSRLDGSITVKIEKATPGQNGNVDVVVSASGKWKYQFTTSQKSNMAKHIARETKADAKAWLLKQTGVTGTSISITGPFFDLTGDNTLPDDVSAITING